MDSEDFGGSLKILSGVQQIGGQGLQKDTVICLLSNGLQGVHMPCDCIPVIRKLFDLFRKAQVIQIKCAACRIDHPHSVKVRLIQLVHVLNILDGCNTHALGQRKMKALVQEILHQLIFHRFIQLGKGGSLEKNNNRILIEVYQSPFPAAPEKASDL